MKLKKLILKNFCQHEFREVDFSLGLTGLIGANGSGKSNIIKGLVYAITGTLPDNLDAYIRKGSTEGSSVELTFESETTGVDYYIRRGLSPRRVEFYPIGKEEAIIRKSKEVDAFLTDELGIDFNIVKNILAVGQEDFVSFFNLTDSERSATLQRLFGFNILKSGREDIRQLLQSTAATSDAAATLKSMAALLETERANIKPYSKVGVTEDLRKKKNSCNEERERINADLECFKMADYIRSQETEVRARLDEAEVVLSKMERPASAADLENKKTACDNNINNLIFSERDVLNKIDTFIKYRDARANAYNSLLPIQGLEPENPAYLEECRAKCIAIRTDIQKMTACAATGVCPTCGQKYDNVQEHLDTSLAELAELEKETARVYAIHLKYQESRDRFNEAKYEMTSCKQDWIRDPDPEGLEIPLPDMLPELHASKEAAEKERNEVEAQREALGAEIEVLRRKGLEYQDAITRRDMEAAALKRLEAAPKPIPQQFKRKEDAVTALKYVDERRAALDTEWEQALMRDSIQLRIFDMESRIKELKTILEKDVERAAFRKNVEDAYAMLSPDEFPKQVLIGMLNILSSNINSYLSLFNADFSVVIQDNSTELVCDFGDGIPMVASRLSGGQKVVLAISWRLALHNTFSSEESCGFLTLDEPTTFLDSANIDNLAAVMRQVRQTASDTNLQVIVITHEKELEALFDNVVLL